MEYTIYLISLDNNYIYDFIKLDNILFNYENLIDWDMIKSYYKNNKSSIGIFLIGYIFHKGLKCNINYKKAEQLYSKILHFLPAKHNYGSIFMKQGHIKSVNILSECGNYAPSLHTLGCYYHRRKLRKDDLEKAIFYYNKAIDLNYTYSMNNLGLLYLQQEKYEKALFLLEMASGLNDRQAYKNLARIYNIEIEKKYNYNLCIYLYNKAINLNDPEAMISLGNIYFSSMKDDDFNKGLQLFIQASKLNNREAIKNLGLIYLTPEFNILNENKGICYLQKAIKLKCVRSMVHLADYYNNKNSLSYKSKALKLYRLALQNCDNENKIIIKDIIKNIKNDLKKKKRKRY